MKMTDKLSAAWHSFKRRQQLKIRNYLWETIGLRHAARIQIAHVVDEYFAAARRRLEKEVESADANNREWTMHTIENRLDRTVEMLPDTDGIRTDIHRHLLRHVKRESLQHIDRLMRS